MHSDKHPMADIIKYNRSSQSNNPFNFVMAVTMNVTMLKIDIIAAEYGLPNSALIVNTTTELSNDRPGTIVSFDGV
jgi:hypothetical protein